MGELANCEQCGAVFVKTIRPICRDCYKQEEANFRVVYQFLKEQNNREATRTEISDETGVDEALISKFVKERRLRPANFPNLSYPCEQCGAEISTGRLCEACAGDIKAQLAHHESIEQLQQKRQYHKQANNHAYYTINKHKND